MLFTGNEAPSNEGPEKQENRDAIGSNITQIKNPVNLAIYEQYDFKFFPCKPDKSPDTYGSWQDHKNHITREEAEELQKAGRMIGAWIPPDVVVLDLDRHAGKPNGLKTFSEIKNAYNLGDINFQSLTFGVRTKSGGRHVFFYKKEHGLKQGEKAPGIDLKTHTGYVIAAGSPGYTIVCDAEPMELPDNLYTWLLSLQADTEKGEEKKDERGESLLPISQLKTVLGIVPAKNFRSNDRWLKFIAACIATYGDTAEVFDELDAWSRSDPEYQDDRSVKKRIESFRQRGGITKGTFIHFLQEEGLPNLLIGQVEKYDPLQVEIPEDTHHIFFRNPTNGTASDILIAALKGKVIAQRDPLSNHDEFFIRDPGCCFYRPFSEIRIKCREILEKNIEEVFTELKDKTSSDDIQRLYQLLGRAFTKARTKDFLNATLSLFADSIIIHPTIPWNITPEALPTLTNVIDFSGDEIISRPAKEGEFFRDPIPCTANEILNAGDTPRFDAFLKTLFPDPCTQVSARHCLSAHIANKAQKTFQIWVNREGDGGKNTLFDFLRLLVPGRIKMLKNALIVYKGNESERRFGEIELQGVSGVFFDEVGGIFDIAKIKTYTSLSVVRGEAKGRASVEFSQTWAVCAMCNELPKFFPADDGAFLSRLFVLPFGSIFYVDDVDYQRRTFQGVSPERLKPARDKEELLKDLLEERPAIIRALISAWIDMRKHHGGKPYSSHECETAKENYRIENDEIEAFFNEHFRASKYDKVAYPIIKKLYTDFTGREESMRKIIKLLTARFPFIEPSPTSNGVRHLKGIALQDTNTSVINEEDTQS